MADLCSKCKKNERRSDSSWCNECHRKKRNDYYHRNRDLEISKSLDRINKRQNIINIAKDQPCKDCGIKYEPYIMQFDHLSSKVKSISQMMSHSIENILAEIAKCDVVCANCHAERTYKRSHNPS